MLIAAAVCPHPPLLLPAAADGASDSALAELRDACDAAVASVLAARPDVLVVVGGGVSTTEYAPDATGTLADYGVPVTIGDGTPVLPLSLTVARWLLARADSGAVRLQAVGADTDPGECLALGAKLAAQADKVAILAMGDGPGRRARGVPGARDEAADRYDARVTDAVSDLSLFAALDPADDTVLFVAGRTAWQVLAGAASPGASYPGALLYAGAPFEVSYYVATWAAAR